MERDQLDIEERILRGVQRIVPAHHVARPAIVARRRAHEIAVGLVEQHRDVGLAQRHVHRRIPGIGPRGLRRIARGDRARRGRHQLHQAHRTHDRARLRIERRFLAHEGIDQCTVDTLAARGLPRRDRIHAAVVALDVVTLIPVGVADAHRQGGQLCLLRQRHHRLDVARIGVDRGGEEFALRRRRGAELQQRQRATGGTVVAQHVGALAVERRHLEVGLDLHAQRLLRHEPVERAAMQRRALEVGRVFLRVAGQQVGACRPERARRQGPRRGTVGRGIGHQLEAAGRLGHVAARECRHGGVPVGVGRHAGLDGNLDAPLRVGFELARAQAAAPQLDLLGPQDFGRRLAVEQHEGGVEAAIVGHALQPRSKFRRAAGIGAVHGAGGGEVGRARRGADEGCRREFRAAGRAPRQGETVDRGCVGMVVVFLEPGRQLVVACLVVRTEQSLRADIAHQRLVLELTDVFVRLRPVSRLLRLEDAAVTVAGFVVEDGRQPGDDRVLVEFDDGRRRHIDRGARRGTGRGSRCRPGHGGLGGRGVGRLRLDRLLGGLRRSLGRHQGGRPDQDGG